MIAMALSCRPKLLICDEPTSTLDVSTQSEILKLIGELKKEVGTSILYITHNLGVIAQICQRVGIMYAGKLVEIADTMTIFDRSLHPYTKGLISAYPRIDIDVDTLPNIPGVVPNLIDPPPGCIFHPRCTLFKKGLCDKEMPKLIEVEKGHFVRCWLMVSER